MAFIQHLLYSYNYMYMLLYMFVFLIVKQYFVDPTMGWRRMFVSLAPLSPNLLQRRSENESIQGERKKKKAA